MKQRLYTTINYPQGVKSIHVRVVNEEAMFRNLDEEVAIEYMGCLGDDVREQNKVVNERVTFDFCENIFEFLFSHFASDNYGNVTACYTFYLNKKNDNVD